MKRQLFIQIVLLVSGIVSAKTIPTQIEEVVITDSTIICAIQTFIVQELKNDYGIYPVISELAVSIDSVVENDSLKMIPILVFSPDDEDYSCYEYANTQYYTYINIGDSLHYRVFVEMEEKSPWNDHLIKKYFSPSRNHMTINKRIGEFLPVEYDPPYLVIRDEEGCYYMSYSGYGRLVFPCKK